MTLATRGGALISGARRWKMSRSGCRRRFGSRVARHLVATCRGVFLSGGISIPVPVADLMVEAGGAENSKV